MGSILNFGLRRTESVNDYVGVLVPLKEAHRYSYSARTGRTEFESRGDGHEEEDVEGKDGDNEAEGMLQMQAAEYTIDGLRKETRGGQMQRSSDYESEFLL